LINHHEMSGVLGQMSTLSLEEMAPPLTPEQEVAPPLTPEQEVIELLREDADNIFRLGAEGRLTPGICAHAISVLRILGEKGSFPEFLDAINCWTSELCWLALKSSPGALEYIPQPLQTDEMRNFAANQHAAALRSRAQRKVDA
jgi:hypothetical protein